MSKSPKGYTSNVDLIDKWVVRTGDGEIVCIDADYEIAVLIWHKLLNSVKQIQLELF